MEKYIVHCYLYDYGEFPKERCFVCDSMDKALTMAQEEAKLVDYVTIYKATEITMLCHDYSDD